MIDLKRLPYGILPILRQREGLGENDASGDERISRYSLHRVLRECIAWKLGHGDWADEILNLYEAAKVAEVKEKP